MIGKTILHYRVLEHLGAGGMGDVYRALDTRLDRVVALKFLSEPNRSNPESRRRLLAEARAASAISSPNIAITHDIAEHEGLVFIVMEYVEGDLLVRKLERGPLSPREAVEIAAQTAGALEEAHARGIIHRDIKSANLMITPRGQVKVLDFGLAKFLESRQQPGQPGGALTTVGTILGTLSYMSPEQAQARPLDPRSDLFSLGVVIYEMLTARLPFEAPSLSDLLDQILHHHPRPPAELNPEVPASLSDLTMRTLEKDPALRPPSARHLQEELRAVARALDSAGEPVTVRLPAGPGASVPESGAERRPENVVAVMTFSNITHEAADDWIGNGIAETVTSDLQKIEGLSVIARARIYEVLQEITSRGMPHLDERLAISLGRRLGATWIVSGGYQRRGQLIRITAELLDVRTGALTRSVKVDGQIDGIFDLQDRIVYELSQGLNLKLRRAEISAIERDETNSVEAYEAYSRAMMNFRTGERDALDRAIYLFEKALEHDRDYAAAWTGLGGAYNFKGNFLSMPELLEKAIECERKAIALHPRSADAHTWLAMALGNLGRHEEAIQASREAVRLDPANPNGHFSLGRLLWIHMGMLEEGAKELERATALNPEAGYPYHQLALVLAILGRYDRAEAAARKAAELQERAMSGNEGLRVVGAHTRLGYVHYLRGRYDQAIEEYRRELDFLSSSDHLLRDRTRIELNAKLGAAHLRQGKRAEADRYFEQALRSHESRVARGMDDPFTRYYIACLHALRGNPEGALESLRVTLKALPLLTSRRARVDPDLESIRGLPEFALLVERR